MSNEALQLLQDTTDRLFGERVDKDLLLVAEGGTFAASLWHAVEAAGLTQPHRLSDDGAAWLETHVLARAIGRFNVPLPLAETMLAGWLLESAGLEAPDGPLTLAVPRVTADANDRLDAAAARVPWARHVRHAVVVLGEGVTAELALVGMQDAAIEAGENLAREPRDEVRWQGAPILARAVVPHAGERVELYGALLRAGQLAGALETLLDLSVRYAGERIQFGKPLAQFQAIQQELARLAGHVAEAGVATHAAFAAAQRGQGSTALADATGPAFEIAAAKVVCGEAAEMGPRIAHQVHGAIGFTYEHALHFTTRRLWSWRAEFGTASTWAERLGRLAYEVGADGLWPFVTGRGVTA